MRALLCIGLVAASLQGCSRDDQSEQAGREAMDRDLSEGAPREFASSQKKPTPTPPTRRIMAAWYPVPPQSLAKRRAPHEFTAAHNTLPLGTLVRVTNPDNGRSLTVRITDRGIHDRRVKLDVCKEAAVELGIVREGFADLKMQVVTEGDDSFDSNPPSVAAESDHLQRTE